MNTSQMKRPIRVLVKTVIDKTNYLMSHCVNCHLSTASNGFHVSKEILPFNYFGKMGCHSFKNILLRFLKAFYIVNVLKGIQHHKQVLLQE